jgi:hypothetical protein
MSASLKLVLLAVLLAAMPLHAARAGGKTVCTITVNSPDERETFRRWLPAGEFEFVELVERGRPDWLASACRAGVRCDVLVISGHFDDGSEFYSDRLDAREHLPVDEMQRVACSESCPGLFSQLKEVYLFGCNTLNDGARMTATPEIARSLVRDGYSAADAQQRVRELNERHAESNRDRMRSIFKDVPVIYGFTGKAPLGHAAGPLLDRYFRAGAGSETEIGSGRASGALLGLFGPSSMTAASGLTDGELLAAHRQDACHFSDDRLTRAQKLDFVSRLLARDMAEVRMFLERIESYVASLGNAGRAEPDLLRVREAIARDAAARERYLAFARDADEPAVRVRMIDVAHRLGWLTPAEQRAEFTRMIGERIAANATGETDVDLVCSRNATGELDAERARLQLTSPQAERVANAAILACLGSAEGRARALAGLTRADDAEVRVAQVYVRHRPIAEGAEMREVTSGVARMRASPAQVLALETLAAHRLSDRSSLDALTRLFPLARSVDVQRAIAGVLIRADYRALATGELARTLRAYRLKSPDGEDMIDILIRRLRAS